MTSNSVDLGRSYSSNFSTIIDTNDEFFIPTNLLSKDYVIFYHPSMERLARNLHGALVKRHNNIASTLGSITWKSFPDGFPDIFIHNIQDLVDRDVLFIGAFNQPSDIFAQLSVCQMIPTFRTRSFSIILPYNPVATMERSSVPGEVITGVTLSRMFGTISCKIELFMVDLHTFHNLHYFPDNVHAVFVHSAHKLKQILISKPAEERERFSIVFPDYGSMQRYRYVIPPFDCVVCSKIREGDRRYITITQGQEAITGRDLVLLDDLVHSGGTLKECITALRKDYQPRSISLFVTHAIFENDTWKAFVEMWEQGIIQTFYLCDTTPQAVKLDGIGPFRTISIADDLADVLVHNRQIQYEELHPNHIQLMQEKSILPGVDGSVGSTSASDLDIHLKSPAENQHQCTECTALMHRHARALVNQHQFFNKHYHPAASMKSPPQSYNTPVFESRPFRPTTSHEIGDDFTQSPHMSPIALQPNHLQKDSSGAASTAATAPILTPHDLPSPSPSSAELEQKGSLGQ